MHISVYLFIFANRIITITPKPRKGKTDMKSKYIVQYSPTGEQQSLQSLSKNATELVYEFETTELEEAMKVAKKEVEVSDLVKIEGLPYSWFESLFYNNVARIEITERDEDGEFIGRVEFDSPTYFLGEI